MWTDTTWWKQTLRRNSVGCKTNYVFTSKTSGPAGCGPQTGVQTDPVCKVSVLRLSQWLIWYSSLSHTHFETSFSFFIFNFNCQIKWKLTGLVNGELRCFDFQLTADGEDEEHWGFLWVVMRDSGCHKLNWFTKGWQATFWKYIQGWSLYCHQVLQ